MGAKRKGDLKTRTRFGSERLFKDSGNWFFTTREGTLLGPFEDQFEANDELKMYLYAIASDLIGELSLETLEAFGSE